MDALAEFATELSRDIDKIPGLKCTFNDQPGSTTPMIRVDTVPIKIGSLKGRVYILGHVTITVGSITVEHATREGDPPKSRSHSYRNGRPKLIVDYAEPESIKKVMEFVLMMAKMKIGSLKGSYASSITYHENIIKKEKYLIDNSVKRREVVTGIQERLNTFELED